MPALSIYTLMIINKSGGLVYTRVRDIEREGAQRRRPGSRRRFNPLPHLPPLPLPTPPPSKQDFEPSASRMDLNEALRVASVWHSVSEIARQLSPVPTAGGGGSKGAGAGGSGALVAMASDTFDLHCLPAPTGVRFVCVAAPGTPHVPHLLARCGRVFLFSQAAQALCRGRRGSPPASQSRRGAPLIPPLPPKQTHDKNRIYEHYADFVVKDPFHERDQVIKAARFDAAVEAAVRGEHAAAVAAAAAAAAAGGGGGGAGSAAGGGGGLVAGSGGRGGGGGGGLASGLLGSLVSRGFS
jgi:hypothetical protein